MLRSRLLAERRALPRERAQRLSLVIQKFFLGLPEFTQAKVIALYHSFWNEVSTDLIAEQALASGQQVLYPTTAGARMSFVAEATNQQVSLEEINLIVVPGVVFDTNRHRIGLGKGFYDRTLVHFQGLKVALAYDFQVLTAIPFTPRDLVCDRVITELRQL